MVQKNVPETRYEFKGWDPTQQIPGWVGHKVSSATILRRYDASQSNDLTIGQLRKTVEDLKSKHPTLGSSCNLSVISDASLRQQINQAIQDPVTDRIMQKAIATPGTTRNPFSSDIGEVLDKAMDPREVLSEFTRINPNKLVRCKCCGEVLEVPYRLADAEAECEVCKSSPLLGIVKAYVNKCHQ